MSPSSGNAGIDREEAVPASAAPWPSSAAALEAPTSCSNRALEIRKSNCNTKMNEPIEWNKKNTKWFYDICLEEIRSKNMEVGNLSENACHMIWQKLSKKGISCNEKQIRSKWEASKRIHSFWYKKVVSAKDAVKDDKWWKKVLKTRISLLEYRELKNGAPKDLDSLDIIFGCNETEKDVQSSESLQQDVAFLQESLEFVTRDRDCMRKQLIEVEVLHQNHVDGLTKKVSLLSDKLQQFENEIKDLKKLLEVKDSQIIEGDELRKKMNEMILELKGKMRVFIRVRPGKGSEDHISYPQSLELKGRGIEVKETGHVKQYVYDKVFGPDTKQKQIFDEMSELIESSFDGHKVCIFAYGPNGSGKTHTMIGGSCNESAGLIPRSLKQIFARIDSMQNWNYTVHLSAAEIYLKDLYDLLAPGRCKIQDFNLIEIMMFDTASSIAILEEVVRKRSVRETKMNSQSSRSHFIFKVRISGFNEETRQSVLGFLVFIDLAGSERVSKSGAEGESLKEAAAINNSLHMLTTTLCDIAKDDNPTFRNTKLTHFLKPYLMGGPKTLMLVNISPEASSISETTLALQFAERTKVWGNEKTSQLGGHYSTSFLSPNKIVSQHIPEGQRKNKQFSVTSKVEQIKRYQPICSSVRKGLGTISRQTNMKKRNRHEDMVEGGNKQQKIC